MRDIEAVVFDLDDTLYRERRFVLSGLAHVARLMEASYGAPAASVFRVMQHRLRRGGRRDALQAACRAFGLPARDIPGWVNAIRSHAPDLRTPRLTVTLLRALRADGFRLGILTNGFSSTQRAKVRALGLAPLVDVVMCAADYAPGGKPHRACFGAVAESLGVSACRTVFVGDDAGNDIAGARAAGMRTIWITSAAHTDASAADAVVTHLGDVPSALNALGAQHAHAC